MIIVIQAAGIDATNAKDFPIPTTPMNFVGAWHRVDFSNGYAVALDWEAVGDYQAESNPNLRPTSASYEIRRTPAWSDGTEAVTARLGGGPIGDYGPDSNGSLNLGGNYWDFDVKRNQTYTYTIRAVSPWEDTKSDPVSVTVPINPETEDCRPFRLFATQLPESDQVKLFWVKPCDATQYKILMKQIPVKDGVTTPPLTTEEVTQEASYTFAAGAGTYTATVTAQFKDENGKFIDLEKLTKDFRINEKPKDPDFGCQPPADPILGNPGGNPNGWPNGWHLPDFSDFSKKWAAALDEGTLPGDAIGGRVHKPYLYFPGRELWWPKYDTPGEISVSPSGVIEYGTKVTTSAPGEPTDTFYPAHIGTWGLYGTGYLFSAAGYRMGFKPAFVKASAPVIIRAVVDENQKKIIGTHPRDRQLYLTENRPANAGLVAISRGSGDRTFSNGATIGLWGPRTIPEDLRNVFTNFPDEDPVYPPEDPARRASEKLIAHEIDLIGPLQIRGTWENGMCGTINGPTAINVTELDLEHDVSYIYPPHLRQAGLAIARVKVTAREVNFTGEFSPLPRRTLVLQAAGQGVRAFGTRLEQVALEDSRGISGQSSEVSVVTDQDGQAVVYVLFSGDAPLELWDQQLEDSSIEFSLASAIQTPEPSFTPETGTSSIVTTEKPTTKLTASAPTALVPGSPKPTGLTLTATPNFPLSAASGLQIRTLTSNGEPNGTISSRADGTFEIPVNIFGETEIEVEVPAAQLTGEGLGVANRNYNLTARWDYSDGTHAESSRFLYLGSAPPIEFRVTPEWPEGVDPAAPRLSAGEQVPLSIEAFRRVKDGTGKDIEVPVTNATFSLTAFGYRDALDARPSEDMPWVPAEDVEYATDGYYTWRQWQKNYLNDVVFPDLATSEITTDFKGKARVTAHVPTDVYPSWAFPYTERPGIPMTFEISAKDEGVITGEQTTPAELSIMTVDERIGLFRLSATIPDGTGADGATMPMIDLEARGQNVDWSDAGPFTAGANIDFKAVIKQEHRPVRAWSAQRMPEIITGMLGMTLDQVERTNDENIVRLLGATDANGTGQLKFALSPGLRFPGATLNLSMGANKAGYLGRTQVDQYLSPSGTLRLQAPIALHLRSSRSSGENGKLRVRSMLTTAYGDSVDWYFTERARYLAADSTELTTQFSWLTESQADPAVRNDGDQAPATQPAMSRITSREVEFDFGSEVNPVLNHLQAVYNLPANIGYPIDASPSEALTIDWSAVQSPTSVTPEGTLGDDLADSASVTCSSELTGLDRCFQNRRTDWLSTTKVNSWIELTWDTPQTLTSITLTDGAEKYFRLPTGKDFATLSAELEAENKIKRFHGWPAKEYLGLFERNGVTYVRWQYETRVGGTLQGALTFSDGSTIIVGSIPYQSQPLTISFSPKTVTSVRFTVDRVHTWLDDPYYDAGSTGVVGLREFTAGGYKRQAAETIEPQPEATTSPSPTETPVPTESPTDSPTTTPTVEPSPEVTPTDIE